MTVVCKDGAMLLLRPAGPNKESKLIATKPSAIAVCAIFVFLGAAPLLAQQTNARDEYLVELEQSAEDADQVGEALARRFGGWVVKPSGDGFRGVVLSLSDERAQQLASDPRVKSVRPTATAAAVPRPVHADASLRDVGADGTPLGPITIGPYRYDAAGNIIHIGSDRFTYDRMGRIKSGTAYTAQNSASQSYAYDGFGNLKNITTSSGTNLYIDVDPLTNKMKASPGPESGGSVVHNWAGGANGGYDAAGHQTVVNGGMYVYEYDSLDALRRQTAPKYELYLYDADEERIAAVSYVSSQTATWRYTVRGISGRALRVLTDTITNGSHAWTTTTDYVYRAGALLATVKPQAGGGDQRTHFHLDHLGSPRLITDENGDRLATHKYWPFGVEAPGGDNDGERMKFTGHERDLDGNDANVLDYMHARYYRSASGRFLSMDAAPADVGDPQTWNRYAYAANNPILFTDPTGNYYEVYGFLNDALEQQFFNDLKAKTGLTIQVNQQTKRLEYTKDASGKPAVATDAAGTPIGSAKARGDLIKAMDDQGQRMVVNRVDNSPVWMGEANVGTGGAFIKLDFADMAQINTGANASGTLDAAFIFLHEGVGHGYMKMNDPIKAFTQSTNPLLYQQKGDVVDWENKIRNELNLPERKQYRTETDPATNKKFIPFANGPVWLP